MKRFNVIVISFISFVIFSCSKKDEVVTPQNKMEAQSETKPSQQKNVPHFDEGNSTKVTWEDLPALIKNAIPLETKAEQTKGAVRALYSSYSYSVGPWGGNGRTSFAIYPPNGSRLYAIAIRSASIIDRITIWYMKSDGTIFVGGDKGGDGGTYYVQYFSADQYIKSVSGRSGGYLDRLAIYTNKKSLAYGGFGGSPFTASVPSGYQILGFFGGSG